MISPESIAILKAHQLKVTKCRISVINFFLEHSGANSQKQIESECSDFNRVTIYRTLNSLVKAGVLHKIPNESGMANYALSHHTDTKSKRHDNHVHFKCQSCGKIECLEDKKIPHASVPKGYTLNKVNLILDGVCVNCA